MKCPTLLLPGKHHVCHGVAKSSHYFCLASGDLCIQLLVDLFLSAGGSWVFIKQRGRCEGAEGEARE